MALSSSQRIVAGGVLGLTSLLGPLLTMLITVSLSPVSAKEATIARIDDASRALWEVDRRVDAAALTRPWRDVIDDATLKQDILDLLRIKTMMLSEVYGELVERFQDENETRKAVLRWTEVDLGDLTATRTWMFTLDDFDTVTRRVHSKLQDTKGLLWESIARRQRYTWFATLALAGVASLSFALQLWLTISLSRAAAEDKRLRPGSDGDVRQYERQDDVVPQAQRRFYWTALLALAVAACLVTRCHGTASTNRDPS